VGEFTPLHRGGSGPPLLLVHGFAGTWRTWELVLEPLERRHAVLATTLPGHAGGPPLDGPGAAVLADALEAAMDDAGFDAAHVAGNSLGGFLALELAARGRALSVVALAPAGGWDDDGAGLRSLLERQAELLGQVRAAVPYAEVVAATPARRRDATRLIVEDAHHLTPELVVQLIRSVAACDGAEELIEHALRDGWPPLDPARVTCPVRFVWGTSDRLLSWPEAAAGYRRRFPHTDWVVLEGVGHCPQLELPLETVQLILGHTGG
jgi:pimeloyl-ACP methyl ester carboxylesterase